jgi:hypothetical protein
MRAKNAFTRASASRSSGESTCAWRCSRLGRGYGPRTHQGGWYGRRGTLVGRTGIDNAERLRLGRHGRNMGAVGALNYRGRPDASAW